MPDLCLVHLDPEDKKSPRCVLNKHPDQPVHGFAGSRGYIEDRLRSALEAAVRGDPGWVSAGQAALVLRG